MSTASGLPLYLLNQSPISSELKRGELYNSLRKDFQELEERSKVWLTSKEEAPISTIAGKHIEQLFAARIKALKCFAKHKTQIESLYNSVEQSVNRSYDFDKKSLMHLHENVRFALRTARRIIDGASSRIVGGIDLDQIEQNLNPENFSYGQLKTMLVLGDSPMLNIYLHFLTQGLMLDFAMIAAFEIMDHPNQYEDFKINDLSWFIVDASQEVGASAVQLGIVKARVTSEHLELKNLSKKDVKREQQLAEAGFEDWAKNLE